jgi:RNA polymerase sigma-70 factor (ECF subfamily)
VARIALTEALVRLGQGDRSAMTEVYRGLRPAVRALARRMLASPDDAADVAEEVLYEVFTRASDFDGEGDALAWALTITTWRCRTERKRRSRRRTVPLDGDVDRMPLDSPGPDAAAEERELRAALQQAALDLTDRDREALERVLAGEPLDAALRKRKERLLVRLRRALLGETT